MSPQNRSDIFFSYSHKDKKDADRLAETLESHGLSLFRFTEPQETMPETDWVDAVHDGLERSQHLLVLCSPRSTESRYVKDECKKFYKQPDRSRGGARKVFLYPGKDFTDADVPRYFDESAVVREPERIVRAVYQIRIDALRGELDIRDGQIKPYVHDIFWKPLLGIDEQRPGELHIVVCGRYVPEDSRIGEKARTQIDKWDYETVVDLTRFLAANYPNAKIAIERPLPKMGRKEIEDPQAFTQQRDELLDTVRGKNVAVVGSPDVSDVAEILLAQLHGVHAYSPGRDLKDGYVFIKNRQQRPSSFYWERKDDEVVGVAEIENGEIVRPFATSSRAMCGILTVGENPVGGGRLLVLAGSSGPATNGIAKLLTDKNYREEMQELVDDYKPEGNQAAVVEVGYSGARTEERDRREIEKVSYKGYRPIQKSKNR